MFEDMTIVCPTAGYKNLVRSLWTFREYAPGAQIIVVDQAAEPALNSEEIKQYTDMYIWAYRALGYSKAMNTGLDIADREYVVCANDDVELIHINWWNPIKEIFNEHYDIAGINPASVKGYRNESDNLPYKEKYTDEDWNYLNTERMLESSPVNPIKPHIMLDGIMTWFTVFRKTALDSIKDNGCYFDEKFYPGGGEDYDLMCRMYDNKLKGLPYRVVGIYSSWAYHHWSSTYIKNPPKVVPELRWNKLDKSPDSKWKDNWGLWGRKDKNIPAPPCTKIPL